MQYIVTAFKLQFIVSRERRVTGDSSEVEEQGTTDNQENNAPPPETESHQGEEEVVDTADGGTTEATPRGTAEDQSSQTQEVLSFLRSRMLFVR